MRRIVRAEAVCLRVQDYHESSKIVTFLTLEHGKVSCLAKGARRLKSKFGASLDLFAQSRIIYYWRETRELYALSDAELVHSSSALTEPPERFLAAEQLVEFVLRVIQLHDPNPQLYRLLVNYFSTLESVPPPLSDTQSRPASLLLSAYPSLVCSFLLKAASFLGFRPELRRCLICRRPHESSHPAYFDAGRGGIICSRCAGDKPRGTRLDPASLDTLAFLLYTPASDIAGLFSVSNRSSPEHNGPELPVSGSCAPQSAFLGPESPLDLVLGFLGHHFDPLVLNSFRWHAGLERTD
jgi:DNA repair protein RecO (recombination protein O)